MVHFVNVRQFPFISEISSAVGVSSRWFPLMPYVMQHRDSDVYNWLRLRLRTDEGDDDILGRL